MILTQAQAEAVQSSMRSMNHVRGRINVEAPAEVEGHSVNVLETHRGVLVRHMAGGACRSVERYDSQVAFATAYALE